VSTRRAKKGQPLRQERYSSSSALPKGLLGNMVAKRCAAIVDPEFRKLVYFLHEVSLRGNTPLHPSCNLFPAWPWPSTSEAAESPLERVSRELLAASESRIVAKTPRAVVRLKAALPKALAQLCLDPAVTRAGAELLAPGFRDLVAALLEYQAQFHGAMRGRFAETQTFREISEALDYSLGQRGMVLAEGTYRTGKSHAAQAWCLQHLGEARYVSLSSGGEQTGFFRDLARSLGVCSTAQRKALEMRARVEDALCTQHLLLVIDEADWLWPQGRPTMAPERVNWLMTALVNKGVPVALIGSRNFSRMLANLEKRCPVWGSEQFHGRLSWRKELPNELSTDDLFAITEMLMPEADKETVMLLVGHALRSKGHVATIEATVSRARFYAAQAGRNAEFEDVDRIVLEGAAKPSRPARGPSACSSTAEPGEGGTPAAPPETAMTAGGHRSDRRGELLAYDVTRAAGMPGPLPISPGMFAGSRAPA
jgi:hypothetical protein